ncbi:MAG: M12 family metallo-peptidase [Planctomycetota bacterium]
MSGASLGGGVAYLDVLCNQNYGFGVSGNMTGGTQFPVSQSSNTWDFVVMAHEIGHNFSTSHTHNYCPPLDQCPPSQYFGQCQNSQVCISNGTIMSYCPPVLGRHEQHHDLLPPDGRDRDA